MNGYLRWFRTPEKKYNTNLILGFYWVGFGDPKQVGRNHSGAKHETVTKGRRCLGAFQKIRDTLKGGGGVDDVTHIAALLFKTLLLRLLEVKSFTYQQD